MKRLLVFIAAICIEICLQVLHLHLDYRDSTDTSSVVLVSSKSVVHLFFDQASDGMIFLDCCCCAEYIKLLQRVFHWKALSKAESTSSFVSWSLPSAITLAVAAFTEFNEVSVFCLKSVSAFTSTTAATLPCFLHQSNLQLPYGQLS